VLCGRNISEDARILALKALLNNLTPHQRERERERERGEKEKDADSCDMNMKSCYKIV
jgi:hypothetical protein